MTAQQSAETQLQQVVNMLARRRKLILAMGLFGAALAGVAGFLIPARYTAKAQIVIDSLQVSAISGPNRPETVDELAIETQVTMLTSRKHLRRVRESLLASPPATAAAPAPKTAAGTADEAAVIHSAAGPPPDAAGTPTIEELEANLKIYQERNSRVIAVTYTSTDPEKAAALANQIAKLYIESQADRKKEEKDSGWLEQEITELNHQLSLAKSDFAARQARLAAVRDLQRREGAVDERGEALDTGVLSEVRRDRIALLQSQKELAAIPSDAHPQLQSVTAKIHDIREKIGRDVDRIASQLENEAQIAGSRVRSLEQRLETVNAARSQAQEAELRLRAPPPESAESAQLYEALLHRQQQEMNQLNALPGMRILTVADAPILPASPNPILFIFPALVAFSIAGGFLATILEGLERGLRSERDIKDVLGIPCIGLIPQLARSRSRKLRMYQSLLQNPFAAYTEAIRSLVVATLQPTAPDRVPKVVLITSSVEGEGKTKLAVSFAVYAARLQRRVLLVELAFRRPALLRELGGKADTGVLDVLQGQPLAAAIQHVPELALDYLPLPRNPVDPLELLSGNKVQDLVRQLRESYDCVVIDGAPLLATTEGRLLASVVDKVLFTVKWGRTRRELAQNALGLLCSPFLPEGKPSNFVSAVITQVNLKKHAAYRGGDVAEVLARSFPRAAG
jgi:succinoglycan biosynthesis transport protein ExoP